MLRFFETFFHRRKFRHYPAWPVVILLVIFARSSDAGFAAGIPIIVLGEMIRIWSSGHLLKGRQLATDGPYAFVRHPLYVGNFLIGLGFCIIIWHPLIFLVFLAGFFWAYQVTIGVEEEKLAERFPKAFQPYREQVRSFLPRFSPYPYRSRDAFIFSRIWQHGEQITILAITGLVLAVYLRQELYQHGRLFQELIPAWTAFFVNTAVLLFFQFERRKKKEA